MSELSLGQIKGLTVNSNVVTVPSGHTLYAPGHVIQTFSVTKTDSFSTSALGEVFIPGLEISITPKQNTSKILILANVNISSNVSSWTYLNLYRDSTPIIRGTTGVSLNGTYVTNVYDAMGPEMLPVGMSFLDSPASTSALTYKISFGGNFASLRKVNTRAADTALGSVSTLTIMEIAQ